MRLRQYLFLLLIALVLLIGILLLANDENSPSVTQQRALEISRRDAEQAYRDLTIYRIKVRKDNSYWYIDYELKESQMNGGGPHYIISKSDGSIIDKRYEQ